MSKRDFSGWDEERRARREAHRRRRTRSDESGTPSSEDRKERVLHTRVTEDLADDIRRVAEEMRVPVSNLVRNVLEDVFTVVESVADNVGDVVDDVMSEVERAGERVRSRARRYDPDAYPEAHPEEEEPRAEAPPRRAERMEFPDVVGWQPVILNAGKACAACERELERGARAFVGLSSDGTPPPYLCRSCARDLL